MQGAEPLQYRKIANPIQHFNNTIKGIYEAHMANAELDLAQVEAIQIFHQSRQSQDDNTDNMEAEADIQHAQKVCESTMSLAKLFSKALKPCSPPHSAHIHLSGFDEREIDMLISVCGVDRTRYHNVHWVSSISPTRAELQQGPPDSICTVLKESSDALTKLRIHLQRDGCWNSWRPGPQDRVRKCVAPKKTLDEWLCPTIDGEAATVGSSKLTKKNKLRLALKIAKSLLCFLGSPLLQGPWKSQTILVSEIAGGLPHEDLNIKPYIFGRLTGCLEQDNSEASECMRTKSSILDLALLLWEVFVGEKVTIADEDRDEDEEEVDSLFDALNIREIKSRESSFIDIFCLDIIANCLNLYGQARKIDAAFRAKLYWDIVKPLIKSCEDYMPKKKTAKSTELFSLPTLHRTAVGTGIIIQQAKQHNALTTLGGINKTYAPFPTGNRHVQNNRPSISAVTIARENHGKTSTNGLESRNLQHLTNRSPRMGPAAEDKVLENESKLENQLAKPYMWPKQCVLFDADDRAYEERFVSCRRLCSNLNSY